MKIKYIFLAKTVIAMLVIMSVTIYGNDNRSTDISPNNLNVKDIKIDPHNASIIYTVIEKKGLYRSVNEGETWVFCGSELPDDIKVIAFDPVTKNIYTGTAKSLYMSSDGNKWSYLAKFDSIDNIFIQPTEPSKIYIHTARGFYISTNDERTWKRRDLNLPASFTPMATDPYDPDIIYFVMSKSYDVEIIIDGEKWNEMGIHKSNDHGETLEKISSTVLGILLISPNNKNLMYGTTDKIILKSTDGGISWKEKNISIAESNIVKLVMNPVDDNVLYAATYNYREGRQDFSVSRIFKSIDGGETWQKISEFPVNGIVIDPSNPDILYAGTPQMGIFKSVDAGKTWNAINNGIE